MPESRKTNDDSLEDVGKTVTARPNQIRAIIERKLRGFRSEEAYGEGNWY
jgi:hypothetical protein